MEGILPKAGQGFEPQTRSRSYTWHGLHQDIVPISADNSKHDEVFVAKHETVEHCKDDDGSHASGGTKEVLNMKKPATRRNAWGCMSYADLIARAIESVPERRLTLSQIYEWMIQNVPYFKDKGESSSSAGWKNSIRHNLSLHRRFTRMQNEGTGKSSWWVINNDAMTSKTPRRRAVSMDTKAFEKKRPRVRRKVEALDDAADDGMVSAVTDGTAALRTSSFSERPLDSFASFMPQEALGGSQFNTQLASLRTTIREVDYDDGGQQMNQLFGWNQCGGRRGTGRVNSTMYGGLPGDDFVFSDPLGDGGLSGMYGGGVLGREGDAVYGSSYTTAGVGSSGAHQLTTLRNLSENYIDCPISQSQGTAGTFNETSVLPPASILLPMPPKYRGMPQSGRGPTLSSSNEQHFNTSEMFRSAGDMPICGSGYVGYQSVGSSSSGYGSITDYFGDSMLTSYHDDAAGQQPSTCKVGGENSSVLRQMLSQRPSSEYSTYQTTEDTDRLMKRETLDELVDDSTDNLSMSTGNKTWSEQSTLNHSVNEDTSDELHLDYVTKLQNDCKKEPSSSGEDAETSGEQFEMMSEIIKHETAELPSGGGGVVEEGWEFGLDFVQPMNCDNASS